MTKIVFDIGGTNMRVAEVENGALKNVLKLPTPVEKEDWLPALLDAIKRVSSSKVESVVGGVAGVVSREGVVAKSSSAGWNEYDFAGFLKENVSSNVRIYNDALLAGLGEATYGAGKDGEIVGYIGIGTGIGTSRIVNKKIDSVTGFEAGHHIIDLSNNISWKQKVSGRALKEKYGKYPQALDRDVYEECVRTIAVGVYNSILFWSPDVVVMGGALINEKEGFKVDEIAAAVEKINETLPTLPQIRQSILGDNAGLYGAMAILD